MALQQPSLPPGVYFSPTREDSLDLLNRWIGGDGEMPDARGFVFQADVYGASPDALRRMHPPASTRGGQHTWWFLGETRLRSRRARCGVDGGGCWRLEQSKENQKTPWAEGGFKDGFVFYLGPSRKERTPWLMQEITSARDGGARKQGGPALHRVYVTPHATDDELRGIYGEDGVTVGPDGNKKPVRATAPAEHFDGIAALLPPESVRDLGQENVRPAPSGLLDYYGQQAQNFVGAASPAGVLGQHLQQHGQFLEADVLGQYLQQHGQFLEADVLGQFQQQHGQFLEAGAPGRQQGGFLEARPAAPGLLAEVGADPPSDNLTMIMAEFMAILNEGSAKGEPAQATHRSCSVASPRAGRLICHLSACSVASPPAPSPGHAPAAFSPSSRRFYSPARGDQEGRDPLFCKARDLAGSGGGAHVLEGVGARSGGAGPQASRPQAPHRPAPPPDHGVLLRKSTAWGRRRLAPCSSTPGRCGSPGTFAALTGLVFKEGLCYGKLEAGILTFVIPILLLGHLRRSSVFVQ